MSHPWVTVEKGSEEWDRALELVNEIDSQVAKIPNPNLAVFLQRVNYDLPLLDGWSMTSAGFLFDQITFERLEAYHDAMTSRFPERGFPDMISIVHQWQSHLYEGDGAILDVSTGQIDTTHLCEGHGAMFDIPDPCSVESPEGRKVIAGHQEANKLCPSLRTNLLIGYKALRTEYEGVKASTRVIETELEEFMWETWPFEKVKYFRDEFTTMFEKSEVGLHQMIQTIQYELLQGSKKTNEGES